ncbi:hypothetical protein FD754_003373 [Muntiacus muntjak]|uniref:Uncharacterized protein n=1 Tax=Muntiacus muntjak TaxID=9888 RepID=A0A5N3WDT5_MUNMU|nr:hypothetical protein FD754_003373 [Muntiacus muntjak]
MGARLGRRAGPDTGSEAGAAAGCGPIQSTLHEQRPERARHLRRLLRQLSTPAEGRLGSPGPCLGQPGLLDPPQLASPT